MPADPLSPGPVLPRVLAIVAGIAGPNRRPTAPGPATRLWGGGFWLDSIDLLELMLACDAAFDGVFEGAAGSAMARVETVGDLVRIIEGRGCN
jgi:hypothetical protein